MLPKTEATFSPSDYYSHACGSWSLGWALGPSISPYSYADLPPDQQHAVAQSKVDYNLWSVLATPGGGGNSSEQQKAFDVQLYEKCFHRGTLMIYLFSANNNKTLFLFQASPMTTTSWRAF